MIESLRIRDLGVIADATLPLGPGLTVVTGETGAGKTMVVTALGLLLGERADAGVVRASADAAVVEGIWIVPDDGPVAERAREAGGDVDDGELILGRSLAREGRSRAVVGGRTAPASVLAELGEMLVVVHGQSEQVRLKAPAAQRAALDRFAGAPLAALLGQYRAEFAAWRDRGAELDALVRDREQRAEEAQRLRAAIDEIEALDPQPEEDEQLAARAQRLENLEGLRAAAADAHALLDASDAGGLSDAATLLSTARRMLERAAEDDQQLAPIAEALAGLVYGVGDAAVQLAGYLDGLDADGARELDVVQQRRADLSDLIRRHGTSLHDVLGILRTGSDRLLELDRDDERIVELESLVDAHRVATGRLAADLTAVRTAAAQRLGDAVSAELNALAMPTARLVASVSPRDELGTTGGDEVALLLQPHPGSEPRPLGRGASGGELSRVMLALEVVIAGADPVPTFVFDEVDAGVGGAAAIEIGRRLARLATTSQVLVVTHLAQVAAFARNHLRVLKDDAGAITASSVEALDGPAREQEMARLLSGLDGSETGLAHARELLALANER
jgi:DNA repair protein RecN (Recombination protein N)